MSQDTIYRGMDWPELLARISNLATSDRGKQKLLKLQPLASPEEAEKNFAHTLELQEVVKTGLRPFMESLDLFTPWYQRLTKNAVLTVGELKDVRHFTLEVLALKEALNLSQTEYAASIGQSLMKAEEPLSAIDQIMTPGGEIRNDASETLFQLYNEKMNLVRQIQSTLDRLVRKHDMEPVLQDRYVTTREGRWVLPIRSGKQHAFEGIIHASSQTKQTVFMEPQEVIPLNNRLRQVEVEIEDEIERLLTELSRYLGRLTGDFQQSSQLLFECDVIFSQAQFSLQVEARPCRFTEGSLRLINVRNPLLVMAGGEVIANTVELGPDHRILLLSGPNAGGKTVLLKSLGLACHMARAGLLICADEESEISFFNQICLGVGDAQSVENNLSTFAAHLSVLNHGLGLKGPRNLLLVDEICGSTDPEEGSALARSFIEQYTAHGIFAVITSHLGPLKMGWSKTSGVVNGSLEYSNDTGRPTYQFLLGIPGQSLALNTAKRVGVAKEVIDRAYSYLGPESRRIQEGLNELEQMKAELFEKRKELEAQLKKATAEKRKFELELARLEEKKNQVLENAVADAQKKITELVEQAKVEDIFKKHEKLSRIKQELPKVIKLKSVQSQPQTPEQFAQMFPAGSPVFLPSVGRDGVVQGEPNHKGEVPVLSESMRFLVPFDQLQPPRKVQNPTAKLVRQAHNIAVSLADHERTLDLRGKTVDEALGELEIQLDLAATQGLDRIKIIHGHGTEALKRAVRSYLSRSLYVKSWQAGSGDKSGDGATWVEIEGTR